MSAPLTVTVSTGKQATVVFRQRNIEGELRIASEVSWTSTPTPAEDEELIVSLVSYMKGVLEKAGAISIGSVQLETAPNPAAMERQSKQFLGVGDN